MGYCSKVGEGNRVRLWVDDWLGVDLLSRVYPRRCIGWHPIDCPLLKIIMRVTEVLFPTQFLLGESFVSLSCLCMNLCLVFFLTCFLCRNETDSHIWQPCPSGVLSIRSLHRSLEIPSRDCLLKSLIWHGLAPPRVDVFLLVCGFGQVFYGGQA